jgi:hypothetical protein
VNNKCDIIISSHVPVSASLNINWNGKQIVKKSNQTCIKQPIWDAIDRTLYEDTINTNILETIAREIRQQMKISYTFARSFKKQLQQLFQQKHSN